MTRHWLYLLAPDEEARHPFALKALIRTQTEDGTMFTREFIDEAEARGWLERATATA